MKRILSSVLALVMLGTSTVKANDNSKVENWVKKNFEAAFNSTQKEKWSSDDNFYYVSFEKDGEKYSAVYSKEDGELIGTAALKEGVAIPSSVKTTIAQKFEGYEVTGKAIEITYSESLQYVVTIENESELLTLRVEGRSVKVISKMQKM